MMEIKDVNNNGLLSLLQANRTGFSDGDAAFESFLSSFKGENLSADADNGDLSARKEVASSDLSKYETKKKTSDLNKVADLRPEAVRRKSEDKSEKGAVHRQENAGHSEKRKESSLSENLEKDDLVGKNAEKAEGKQEISIPETEEELSGVREISLDVLALMNIVAVADSVNDELVFVDGAELAARLGEAGIEAVSLDASSDLPQVFPVSDELSTDDAFRNVVRLLQPTEGEVLEVSGTEVLMAASDEVKDDMKLVPEISGGKQPVDEQAVVLSDAVGKDRKVKVEVSVKSEKIADVVDRGLMSAKMSVAGEGQSVEGVEMSGLLTDADSQNLQITESRTFPQPGSAALAMTASLAGNGILSDGVSVASSSDAGGVVLAHAGAVGGEMLSGAGRAPANDDVMAFRDIYKGVGKDVVEQIKVNITKSAVKGVDTIEIQLKPEDLGHIEIKMQIGKDGKLQAHIISSRPETAEILQKEMTNLQKAFDEAGFQTDENSLSFSFRNEGDTKHDQEKSNLRNFIGEALEREIVQDASGGDIFGGMAWDGTSGLNIRV